MKFLFKGILLECPTIIEDIHNLKTKVDVGIAYAVDQIVDLIAQGVDGKHLYKINNPYIAHRIYEAINTLLIA